ncbi:MAG: glycosyltransferase family 2 protein [Oscillospiraceae bacterium]|nr:glycosyltransferase family 2 protein [Oscillospiraceae bacterium]
MPLISVIIPVYNVEKYLNASVESVMAQTLTDIEIILINDGSSDRSGEICRRLAERDSRIKVIDKPNGGVSSARNAGLESSSGEWIYFMDSDDIIEPDTLECAIKKADETGTDVCFFDYDRVCENLTETKRSLADKDEVVKNTNCYRAMFSFNYFGSMCNCIIKADIIRGAVRFNEKIEIGEDQLFKFECFGRISSYSYVPQVKYHYMIRSGSALNTVRTDYICASDMLYEGMMSVKEKYDFPDYAERFINTVYMQYFHKLIMNTFSPQNKCSLSHKLDIIDSFTHTPRFKAAVENNDPSALGKAVMIHKHFNRRLWIINYLAYLISAYKKSRNIPLK